MNGFTLSKLSPYISMPISASPLSRYFLSNSTYQGTSTLQPPHSTAQKSSSTTLPRDCKRVIFLPLTSVSAKSGAATLEATGIRARADSLDTPGEADWEAVAGRPGLSIAIATTQATLQNTHFCMPRIQNPEDDCTVVALRRWIASLASPWFQMEA